MEIELKFAVPNEDTLKRLQALDQIAGYPLSAVKIKHVHDTFLDTPDRLILRSGHVCRRREWDQEILMTLKGSSSVDGALHRREELEVTLPSDLPPSDWPAGPIRDRLLSIIGDAPLIPLFDQRQTRRVRYVLRDDRTIAELSLDLVELAINGREQTYFEIEVEILNNGTKEDLAKMEAYLKDEWDLRPEPRSKFERGLALFMGRGSTPMTAD